MKNIKFTTANITSPIDKIKLQRMNTVSITDKAMSHFEINEIAKGEVKALTIFDGVDDETGEVYEQCVISTDTANYSTCSKSIVSLVGELIDILNEDSAIISLNDVGFKFYKKTTKNGNNCVVADLI